MLVAEESNTGVTVSATKVTSQCNNQFVRVVAFCMPACLPLQTWIMGFIISRIASLLSTSVIKFCKLMDKWQVYEGDSQCSCCTFLLKYKSNSKMLKKARNIWIPSLNLFIFNDFQDDRLTSQYPNQAGHCLLTGRYFEPWLTSIFSFIFLQVFKDNVVHTRLGILPWTKFRIVWIKSL